MGEDFKSRTVTVKHRNEMKNSIKDKMQKTFSTPNLNCCSGRKTTHSCVRTDDDRAENKLDAGDEVRVHNKRSMETLQRQKRIECSGKSLYLNIFRISSNIN